MRSAILLVGLLLPAYASAEPVTVSASTYGEDWPFPVDEGIVRCDAPSSAVVLETTEGTFALNGSALGQVDSQPWLDTRDYQKRDADGIFLNGIDTIRALIAIGLEDC